MENQSPQKKKKGINWGFLIFLLIVFGPQLFAWISRTLSQVSGGSFNPGSSTNIIPVIIIGLVLLSVIVGVVRAIGETTRSSSGQSWPTSSASTTSTISSSRSSVADLLEASKRAQPTSSQATRTSTSWDDFADLFDDDDTEAFHFAEKTRSRPIRTISDMPGAPRFEPVISGAAIGFGLLGALLLGGAFFLGNWLTTVLP
jgi:hypothetical protein